MWDDRFASVKMPEYNAFYDPHCISFISSIRKNRSIFYKRTLSPIKTYSAQGKFNPSKIKPKKGTADYTTMDPIKALKVSKKDVVALKQAVEELWTKNNFPEGHKIAFRRLIEKSNAYKSAVIIVNEMENIERNMEPFQELNKIAERRNTLLNKLLNTKSKNEAISFLQELRNETCEIINRLKGWRSRLGDYTLAFEYGKENYIITIHNDYFKIVASHLANWFSFDKTKADVLLLSPKIIEINSTYFKYHPITSNKISIEDNMLRVPISKDQLHKFVCTQKYFENELKTLLLNDSNKLLFNSKIELLN